MNGLDAWIEGDNVCPYCGLYSCDCQKEDDGELDEDTGIFCGDPIPVEGFCCNAECLEMADPASGDRTNG